MIHVHQLAQWGRRCWYLVTKYPNYTPAINLLIKLRIIN